MGTTATSQRARRSIASVGAGFAALAMALGAAVPVSAQTPSSPAVPDAATNATAVADNEVRANEASDALETASIGNTAPAETWTPPRQTDDGSSGSLDGIDLGAAPQAGAEQTELIPVQPARLLDTRRDGQTIDGDFQTGGRLQADSELRLTVTGRGGVPVGASAVVINVTAIRSEDAGYITAFPCDERPLTSSLNYRPGSIVGNEIVARLSSDGDVCLYAFAETDLVVDVTGYAPTGLAYTAVQPARLVDTRPGESTVDAESQATGRLAAGETLRFVARGRGGVPAEDVDSITVNVTAVASLTGGFLTVFACNDLPLASSLNFAAGDVRGNEVIAQLSDEGDLCVFSSAETHLVVDVAGYTPTNSAYQTLSPSRLLETRPGNETVDGEISLTESLTEQRRVRPGETIEVQVGGRAGIPDENVVAAVMNVTAIRPSANGFLTIFACDDDQPLASALNYSPGDVVGNEVLAQLTDDGRVCIYSDADTDLVVDVTGYVPDWAAPIPLFDEGWRLEPSSVTFTEPNDEVEVRLVHYGDDGRPSGRAVPDGVELRRDEPLYPIEVINPGTFLVRNAEIGAEISSIAVNDGTVLPLWITSVRMAAGAVVRDTGDLVWPPPADAEVTSSGPFTTSELSDRTSPPDAPGVFAPIILRGEQPAVGSVIFVPGSAPIAGRVIEPNGFAAIERADLTLIAIEPAQIDSVFGAIEIDVENERLLDLGLLPDLSGKFCAGTDEAGCVSNGDGPQIDGPSAAAAEAFSRRAAAATGDSSCEAEPGFALGETKVIFDMTPKVLGGIKVNGGSVLAGGSDKLRVLEATFGLGIEVEAKVAGKLRATFSFEIKCEFVETLGPTVPLPGPLAAIVGIRFDPVVGFEMPIEANAGPGVDYEFGAKFSAEAVVGVRYVEGSFISINRSKAPQIEPIFGIEPSLGLTSGLGPVLELESKPFVFLGLKSTFQLLPAVAARINRAFGVDEDDPWGSFTPFEVVVGPRVEAAWANPAKVAADKETAAEVKLALRAVARAADDLNEVLEEVIGVRATLLPQAEFGFTYPTPILAPKSGETPRVTVDDEPVTMVGLNDRVEIKIAIKEPESGSFLDTKILPDNNVLSGIRAYEVKGDGFEQSELAFWDLEGSAVVGQIDMDEEKCLALKDKTKFIVIAWSADELTGAFRFPIYLGEYEVECEIGIEVMPEDISLDRDELTRNIALKQEGLTGADWKIGLSDPDGLPEGHAISFVLSSGTFTADRDEVLVILSCPSDPDDGERGTETAVVEPVGVDGVGTSANAALGIEFNCTDSYLDIPGPSSQEVIGGDTVEIDSNGDDDTEWTPTGRMLVDESDPIAGFLPGRDTESTQPGVFVATTQPDPRKQEPIVLPCHKNGLTDLPESKAPGGVVAEGRGSDSVIVIWEAKDGFPPIPLEPCPPPPPPDPPNDPPGPPGTPPGPGDGGSGGPDGPGGGSSNGGGSGDPHMKSFDGLTYDAQTNGEYIYAQPIDPDGDGPTVIARHEPTTSSPTPFAPTSIKGVFVEHQGVSMEVTQSPFEVYVNGNLTEFPSGSYIELIPGVFVGQPSPGIHRFTTDDIDVTVQGARSRRGFSYLNLGVTVPSDATLVGLLGIPDGDTANDLLVRDPSRPMADWDTISIAEARQHRQELFEFSDSWRLTDPTDSPFTVFDDTFDAPNLPRPGTELLAPFREQAEQLLAGNAQFCSDAGASSSYAIDVFAIELAIGNEVELITCSFDVVGSVRTDDPDTIAVGVEVEVSAPGLTTCVTTTDTVGKFVCRIGPDPEQTAPDDVEFPYAVDVIARPLGEIDAAATATAQIEGKAPFNGSLRLPALDPMIIAATDTALLDVSGTLRSGRAPVTALTTLELTGRSGDGTQVVKTRLTVLPDAAGAYAGVVALPKRVTSVDVLWRVGIRGDHIGQTFDGIAPGVNDLVFNGDYDPPLIDLSGTMLLNGASSTGSIALIAQRDGSTPYRATLPITPDGSGSYKSQTYVPTDVTSIEIIGSTGHPSNAVTATLDAPVGGPNPVTFDVILDAPVLELTGTASVNGTPSTRFDLGVDSTGSTPSRFNIVVRPDASGAFALDVDLPAGSAGVALVAGVGPIEDQEPRLTVTDLVNGPNQVVFDATVVGPVLDLSGRVTGGGVPASGYVTFDVRATDNSYIGAFTVILAPGGEYAASVPLPGGVDEVELTARVGFDPDDRPTTTLSGLVNGLNTSTFDAAYGAVGLSIAGTIEIDGEDATGRQLTYVNLYNAADEVVRRTSVSFEMEPDGAYQAYLIADPTVVRAELSARLGPWPTDRASTEFLDLTVGLNELAYSQNAITHSLDVSGTLTADGTFVGGTQSFVMRVEVPGRPFGLIIPRDVFVNPTNGEYSFQVDIPETTTSATVTAEIGDIPADYLSIDVTTINEGVTPVDLSGDAPIPVTVDITGFLQDVDGAVDGPALIRTVLRNAGGVVETETTSVDVVDGSFTLERTGPSTVTEVDIAWLVGLPGEPASFRTFDGLLPGLNGVSYAEVNDPPVVIVSGVATVNGAPLDADIDIELTSTDASGTRTTGGTVATDPATGAYSYAETLYRSASAVDVAVSSAATGNTSVTATIDPLGDGDNNIVIDLNGGQPVLDVTGTLSLGGVPPSGDVVIAVRASDGAGQFEYVDVTVDPNNVTGAYDFQQLLPPWATEARLTAELGGVSGLWPTQTETGLVDGTNSVVFDAAVDAQLFEVSGAASISGAPYPVPLTFYVSATEGAGWGRFVTADVIDGEYSFALEAPAEATAINVQVRTPTGPYAAEDPSQSFSSLSLGLNELDFDVALRGRGVLATGRLTDSSSGTTVPVTGSEQFYIDSRVAPNALPNFTTNFGVNADANGDFSTFFIVPDNATVVGHATQIGFTIGDRVRQETVGIADGVNEIVHDDDYNPARIVITGNLREDGVPVTGNQLLRIRNAGLAQVTVNPDANGDFTGTILAPRDRTGQEVDVQWIGPGINIEDRPTVRTQTLAVGENPLSFVIDYQTTTITLTGLIGYRGAVPAGITNVRVAMSDGDGGGTNLGERNVAVTPNPDGSYSTTFDISSASESARLTILLDGNRSDQYERFSVVVDTTPGEETTAVLNAQTTSLNLTGTVTLPNDDPYVDEFFLVDVIASDDGVVLDTIEDEEVYTDENGDYSIEVFLPLGTDSVEITPNLVGVDPFDIAITASPGVTTGTADLVTDGGLGVTVSGEIVNSEALGADPTIEVIGYSSEEDGFGPVYWEEESRVELPYVRFGPTDYTGDAFFDPISDFVEVRFTFLNDDFSETEYRRVFDLSLLSAPYALDVDGIHGDDRMEWSGYNEVINDDPDNTFCYSEGYEFMFRATLTGYPDLAAVTDGDPSNDFEIASTIVLPTGFDLDGVGDSWQFASAIPSGIGYTILDIHTDDFYFDDQVLTGYGLGGPFTGGVDIASGNVLDASCVGEPIDF